MRHLTALPLPAEASWLVRGLLLILCLRLSRLRRGDGCSCATSAPGQASSFEVTP